ncbi:hypothetical protein ACVWXL_007546 [Bradyrhizobium sp. GM22.5]
MKSGAGAISTRPASEALACSFFCRFLISRASSQRHPAAHGRADQDLRAVAEPLEYRDAFLEPAPDGSVDEIATGFAVAGIIEPDHGAAVIPGPFVQRHGLAALHVRLETAEPDQPRSLT